MQNFLLGTVRPHVHKDNSALINTHFIVEIRSTRTGEKIIAVPRNIIQCDLIGTFSDRVGLKKNVFTSKILTQPAEEADCFAVSITDDIRQLYNLKQGV